MKRPLKNRRIIGPIFSSTEDGGVDEESNREAEDMFIKYINNSSELLDVEPEEFAKSAQARNYARRLGIYSQVYSMEKDK